MSTVRLLSIKIKNYRSFGEEQEFEFPISTYKKPVAIIGYNNAGKTNLMNSILYGVGQKFVSANTFEKHDLHKLNYDNQIQIISELEGSPYMAWSDYYKKEVSKNIEGVYTIASKLEDGELLSSCSPSFFGTNKHYKFFYINFHSVKDEISTKKTSWGNLSSFLAKHIKEIVDKDETMKAKKDAFKTEIKDSTHKVLDNSELKKFVGRIKDNYSKNLRDNNCEVEFGLPEYEDIFLQMMFKIGLNGDIKNLIPINQFGDGYVSMFVMAVIQAIAESNTTDKCLFLFEEPESFLHENHQEYFYKMVLCNLADRGHQVIYTTHSDRMVDIFDTKGIIRIEFDETKKQTVKKYNDTGSFSPQESIEKNGHDEIVTLDNYNSFIKNIEPNLNKILFSRKVVLVEGPNDIMAYKYAVEKIIKDSGRDKLYAETYLNFLNIAFIAHHGKITSLLLIKLCKHLGLEYFVINDWDLDNGFIQTLSSYPTVEDLKASPTYQTIDGRDTTPTEKGIINTNWKILSNAGLANYALQR